MDEEMMQVDPVMMRGTPAPQQMPVQMQSEMESISGSDQEEAKQALTQIITILQQMVSQGASEEEIQAFLQQVGITMEELQMAREMFGI
tara:strand:- start:206 stop:472 length:267 start_codon:yes stop_codon:yes gene_type:complete